MFGIDPSLKLRLRPASIVQTQNCGCGGTVALLGAHQRTTLCRRRRVGCRSLSVDERHLIVPRTAVDDVIVAWFVVGRRRGKLVDLLQVAGRHCRRRRTEVPDLTGSRRRPRDQQGWVRLVGQRSASAAGSGATAEVGSHRRSAGVEYGRAVDRSGCQLARTVSLSVPARPNQISQPPIGHTTHTHNLVLPVNLRRKKKTDILQLVQNTRLTLNLLLLEIIDENTACLQ